MKEYYYMVNLAEKLSEISVNDFCEVFEDLTGKYDGMWIKVMQTEKWGNYSNQFIVYDSNRPVEIEYNDWKLKPVEIRGNQVYNFYSDWNYTRFGAIIEDSEGNTKDLTDDYWFWEVWNGYDKDRTPLGFITSFIKIFAEMVETNHDVIYYDLRMNSFQGRFNHLAIALSKYKSSQPYNLETGIQKIKWLEKQCIRCLDLSKRYIEERFFPKESVSDILKRYEDALKQALELYSDEIGISKD